MGLMRSYRLSAVVGGTVHPCRAQGACVRHFSQRHDMIEALAPDRSDQPFNMTVLPRRAWRDRPIPDAHGSQPACDRDTIGGVTIADEVAWRLVPWEGFGDLSGDPFGGRMCGHIDPDEPSPLQTQDH